MFDDKSKLSSRGMGRSKYSGVEMTDDSVAHFASLGLTLKEISDLFCVEENTVTKHHGHAFAAGKATMKSAPRIILFNNIRSLQEKFEQHLAEVGEYSVDENGKEIRIPVDVKLAKTVLDYLTQANKLLPQEVNLTVTTPKATELTEEQILAELAKHHLIPTPKKD